MSPPPSRVPRAFVVGHPIQHSRSPLIHGHWLARHGLPGAYERVDVAPEAFPDFVGRLAEQGFVGGNVTIPHKEAAARLCRRLTPRAERLGAVNTLWLERGGLGGEPGGELWGDNTDGVGFLAHLDQSLGTGWDRGSPGSALLLGAGGAARGIAAALAGRALDRILVANRTPEKARALAGELAGAGVPVEALGWDAVSERLPETGLLVNTTSLGMAGQPPLTLDLGSLPATAAVAEIVYVPLTTPLLAAARARGLAAVDGLGMLLHQAVPGFARWFGVTPEVTPELRALVAADIEGGR